MSIKAPQQGQATVPGYMYYSLCSELTVKDAEIARLRKVVEAAKRWKVAYNERDIREAWDAVSDALAELDVTMSDFTESAGNGLTRCLVCNGIGCETWCPRYTLDPNERKADKARRLRVCAEIVWLRKRVEARDAEIATLNEELEQQMPYRVRLSSDLESAVDTLRERDSEIACLRKVVEAARGVLTRTNFGILYQKDRVALQKALAELDEISKK